MPGTTATLLCQHGQDLAACAMCRQHQQAHANLITNLDALLATARPRLLRLARLNGISPDAADDIVQETLFEAWHHLSNLRDPQRFDAWLDSICHLSRISRSYDSGAALFLAIGFGLLRPELREL